MKKLFVIYILFISSLVSVAQVETVSIGELPRKDTLVGTDRIFIEDDSSYSYHANLSDLFGWVQDSISSSIPMTATTTSFYSTSGSEAIAFIDLSTHNDTLFIGSAATRSGDQIYVARTDMLANSVVITGTPGIYYKSAGDTTYLLSKTMTGAILQSEGNAWYIIGIWYDYYTQTQTRTTFPDTSHFEKPVGIGTANPSYSLDVVGTVRGVSPDYYGIIGESGTNIGVRAVGSTYGTFSSSVNGIGLGATSTGGYALYAKSDNSIAGQFIISPVDSTTSDPVINLIRETSGTASAGMGGSIDYYIANDVDSNVRSVMLQSSFAKTDSASERAEFSIITKGTDGIQERFKLDTAGHPYFKSVATQTGTPLVIQSDGEITKGSSASGSVDSLASFRNNTNNPTIIRVDKNGNGDYTTIKAACQAVIPLSSFANQYRILVNPGDYNEYDVLVPAYTEIQGVVPNSVRVWDYTIGHNYVFKQDSASSKLSNLTIDKQYGSYCIHYDTRLSNCVIVNNDLTIIRTTSTGSAIGGGSWINFTVIWNNCHFEGQDAPSCHTQVDVTNFNIKLIFNNCTFGSGWMQLGAVGGFADCVAEFNNCTFPKGCPSVIGYISPLRDGNAWEQPGNNWEWKVTGGGNKNFSVKPPFDYLFDDTLVAGQRLLIETASLNQSVSLSGTAITSLFGEPTYISGDDSIKGSATGNLNIRDIKVGYPRASAVDLIQVWKRLGDCSSSSKTLIVTVGASNETYTFNDNYLTEQWTNQEMCDSINAILTLVDLSVENAVNNYEHVMTADKIRLKVASSGGIAKGDFVRIDSIQAIKASRGAGTNNCNGVAVTSAAENDYVQIWTGAYYIDLPDGYYGIGANFELSATEIQKVGQVINKVFYWSDDQSSVQYGYGTDNYYWGVNNGVRAASTYAVSDNLALGGGQMTLAGTAAVSTGNVGIGKKTLYNHRGGTENTIIGWYAGTLLANVSYNTIAGAKAFYTSQTGVGNSIYGFQAGYLSTSADNNAFFARYAGYSNTTGDNNVYNGYYAGGLNSTGSNNNSFGYKAGYNETGSYKSYWAADSTSWANGMASGSKLLWYADMTNAVKSNHFMNIFAKLSIGAAKDPTVMLEVTGNATVTGSFKSGTGTIANNDSIPDVSGANTFVYNGTANSVAVDDLTNPVVGMYYTFWGNSDTYTLNFPGTTNFVMDGVGVNLGNKDGIQFYVKADNEYWLCWYKNNTP